MGRVTERLDAKGSRLAIFFLPTAHGPRGTASEGGVGLPTVDTDFLGHLQWEKSQLDEEFMHSVENVCGCAKYECGEWEGADGNLRWASWEGPGWARGLSGTDPPLSPIQ